jgi:membrane protein
LRRRLAELGQLKLNPLERALHFFDVVIWEDERRLSGWRRHVYPRLRVLTLVYWNFQAHGAPTHAAALTYTSLLALVPFLAVAFALFQAFGGLSNVEAKLQDLLVQYLAPGMEATAKEYIKGMMENIRHGARANAALATVLLVVTVIRTLSGLEWTFNTIFGVKAGRPWTSRIVVYWAVVTLGPILVGASLTMSATVQSSSFVSWLEEKTPIAELLYRWSPVLFTSIAFALLYLFLPNAKVKPRAALWGGLFAGVAFELAKQAFTGASKSMVASQSEVYGAIATLFVFLFWVYISWTIVLLGLEVVVATQSATTHRKEEIALSVSQKFREMVALRLVTEVCRRFDEGSPPPTVEKMAAAADVPERLLFDVIAVLEEAGIVRRVDAPDEESAYLPGRPLERITVDDVVHALREAGEQGLAVRADEESRYLAQVVEATEEASSRISGAETMRRVVDRIAAARAPASPSPSPEEPRHPPPGPPEGDAAGGRAPLEAAAVAADAAGAEAPTV